MIFSGYRHRHLKGRDGLLDFPVDSGTAQDILPPVMNSTAEAAQGQKRSVSMYPNDELYDRMKAQAKAERRSMASLALVAVEEYLRNHEEKNRTGRSR
jgi:hypothetical protein